MLRRVAPLPLGERLEDWMRGGSIPHIYPMVMAVLRRVVSVLVLSLISNDAQSVRPYVTGISHC